MNNKDEIEFEPKEGYGKWDPDMLPPRRDHFVSILVADGFVPMRSHFKEREISWDVHYSWNREKRENLYLAERGSDIFTPLFKNGDEVISQDDFQTLNEINTAIWNTYAPNTNVLRYKLAPKLTEIFQVIRVAKRLMRKFNEVVEVKIEFRNEQDIEDPQFEIIKTVIKDFGRKLMWENASGGYTHESDEAFTPVKVEVINAFVIY